MCQRKIHTHGARATINNHIAIAAGARAPWYWSLGVCFARIFHRPCQMYLGDRLHGRGRLETHKSTRLAGAQGSIVLAAKKKQNERAC